MPHKLLEYIKKIKLSKSMNEDIFEICFFVFTFFIRYLFKIVDMILRIMKDMINMIIISIIGIYG